MQMPFDLKKRPALDLPLIFSRYVDRSASGCLPEP